jgi:hypothetical protein
MANIPMTKTCLTAAAGAAVVGLLTFLAPTSSEAQEASRCRDHYHVIQGESRDDAISKWQQFTRDRYGEPASSFNRACDRRVVRGHDGWFAIGQPLEFHGFRSPGDDDRDRGARRDGQDQGDRDRGGRGGGHR